MKRFIIIIALVLAGMAVTANPVGKERAQQVAQNAVKLFCSEMHGMPTAMPVVLTDISGTVGSAETYTFNYRYGDIEGFIIISGDDIAAPVLAFSDEGALVANPAFTNQMQHYSRQLKNGIQTKRPAPKHILRKWETLENDAAVAKGDFYHDQIRQLLKLMVWGQSAPYNAKCPGGSVTGCVATAFGMIMNYWDYPEHGFGMHSYDGADNPAAYPNWSFGIQAADFEHTYYDWQHMPDYLTINDLDSNIEAVSTLLYHLGVSLDMHYTPTGSGCWSLPEYAIFDTSLHLTPDMGADTRIPKHFGYRYDYSGLRDSVHDDTLWLQMLYNSLVEGKPIYYAGWAKDTSEAGHSGTSGHGYILDGYFSDEIDSNFFHVNWGWTGTANGLFKLDAMTPQSSDFTQWQGAIIGLEPDTSYHGYDYTGITPVANRQHVAVSGTEGYLTVMDAAGHTISVFDIMGRCVVRDVRATGNRWRMPMRQGVYLVSIDNGPAQKTVVTH